MKKSSTISDDDIQLFRKAVDKITPLKQSSIIPDKPKPKPHPARTMADQQPILQDMSEGEFEHMPLESGDELLFHRGGLQKRIVRKLRRGQFNSEAELDLHGMTVENAKTALSTFMQQCKIRKRRCVRIIHGKGLGSKNKQPIIKNKLNHWLQHRDDVLAFCSARQIDGGTGAIYLLLKVN